jgi:hypothetical protein
VPVDVAAIASFWTWFQLNAGLFGADFENKVLLEKLDKKIADLGPYGWEVGPGVRDPAARLLAFVPGSLEGLEETSRLVDLAPTLPGWEFHRARPPRPWTRRVEIPGYGPVPMSVDVAEWEYVLRTYADGRYGLVLHAPELARMDDERQLEVVHTLLDAEIGEERRLRSIRGFEVVYAFEPGLEGIPVPSLREHFEQLEAKP